MTNLLKEILTERADAQRPPDLDLDAVMRTGERRIRRRRTLTGLTVAAVVGAILAGGLTAGRLVGEPGFAGRTAPLRFTEDRPTWAEPRAVHFGDERIETESEVTAFVKTDAGFVYIGADDNVRVADGVRDEIVAKGIVARRSPLPVLVADDDGPLVAWMERNSQGAGPRAIVVYDVAKRHVVYRSEDAVAVLALDGNDVYLLDRTGTKLVRHELATGESDDVPGDAWRFDGATAGKLVRHVPPPGADFEPSWVIVADDLTSPGRKLRGQTGRLSPGAQWVATRAFDWTLRVFDTETGKGRTVRHPGHSYAWLPYWLDDDRFVTVSLRGTGYEWITDGRTVDILLCKASTASCSVHASDATAGQGEKGFGRIMLPTGVMFGSHR